MKRRLLALAALLIGSSAQAGDAANFQSLGFSKSGSHYAFVESGISDGAGFPYATVTVVDVAKNAVVTLKRVFLESETAKESQAIQKAIAAAGLAKFGISRNNPGRDLLIRLPSDYSTYANALFTIGTSPEGGASVTNPKYEVVLEEKNAPITKDNEFCADFIGNKMIKLSIAGREASNNELVVLQDDQHLPKSRSCSAGYAVHRVTVLGDALVVVLSYRTIGFEGPNVRYMAVTGKLKLKEY